MILNFQVIKKFRKKCAVNGKDHIDAKKIKEFLNELKEPTSFLDFETFQMALPPFDGIRPYQQIPFQYSLHISNLSATAGSLALTDDITSTSQSAKEVKDNVNKSICRRKRTDDIKHFEFLYSGLSDPREEFILSLKKNIPSNGTILAYYMPFEKGRLTELANDFPKHAKFLKSLLPRFVDLIVPFRNFWYYSPMQEGSCSIKYVLPALCGKSYSDMEIKNGGVAALSFQKLMTCDISSTERDKIRKDLLDYCELDTKAMMMILKKLKKVC